MSRRLLKAAEAIREVVSMAILTEIRDPRVENVTVTGVEVAPDMKSAKVSVRSWRRRTSETLPARLAKQLGLFAVAHRRANRHPLHTSLEFRTRYGCQEKLGSRSHPGRTGGRTSEAGSC